jgi:hypothetical protein
MEHCQLEPLRHSCRDQITPNPNDAKDCSILHAPCFTFVFVAAQSIASGCSMSISTRRYAGNDEQFQSVCEELQRNDNTITELLISHEVSMGYGQLLGMALRGNCHLATLELSIRKLLTSEEVHTEGAFRLINFIRSSPSLYTVHLVDHGLTEVPPHHTQRSKTLIEQIAHAVMENKGCGSFIYEGKLADPVLLVNLLKTHHVKQLDMGIGHFEGTAAEHEILKAYMMNDTLEDITLHHWKFGELNRRVLTQLGRHPRLQRLQLRSFGCYRVDLGNAPALAHILSCTRSLQNLDLYALSLDKVTMDVFLAALMSNETVNALSLGLCKMDAEAARSFIGFIKDNANRNGQALSLLSLLHVSFASFPIENAILSMMRGTCLENLHLMIQVAPPPCHSCVATSTFFDCLCENASVIRLSRLEVFMAINGEQTKLTVNQFLAHTTTLTEIWIGQFANVDTSSRLVLIGFRQNGSLQSATVCRVGKSIFNALESEYVSAYCRRNACISSLIADTSTSLCRIAPNCCAADTLLQDSSVALLPSLFKVAMQAMRYAPSNILIGLQSLILDVPVAASNQESGNSTIITAVPLTMRRTWVLHFQRVRRWRPGIRR